MKRARIAILPLAVSLFAAGYSSAAGSADTALIQALEDRYVAAVNAKDVDKIMACYVPGADLFVFDVIPPRQYVGADAYHKDWQGVLKGYPAAVKVEVQDLALTVSGKLAVGHMIQHFVGTNAQGKNDEYNFRVTDVYRKAGGKWLIAQEHISLPVDLSTEKADPLSKP